MDLPLEQLGKIRLVVNLKTEELGLAIPPKILGRPTRQ
jgi:hypothetical protein